MKQQLKKSNTMKNLILSLAVLFTLALTSCSADDNQTQSNEPLQGTVRVLGSGGNQIVIAKYNPNKQGDDKFDVLVENSDVPIASVTAGDSIRISSKISDPNTYDVAYVVTLNGSTQPAESGSLANWSTINFTVTE